MAADHYSIVIPCYNEQSGVRTTLRAILAGGDERLREVIVVDDGSTDATADELAGVEDERGLLRILRHPHNRGYGASLKTGVRNATADVVVITDADGTYPNERIPELVDRMGGADMVVGARTGARVNIPLVRRPAKWLLGWLANTLGGRRIPDLNSGLRAMRRDVLERYLGLLPDGFSFTTTITLVMLSEARRVEYIPINYHQRAGSSKIRPVRDTLNFVQLVCRAVLWFDPLRFFIPLSLMMVGAGLAILLFSMAFMERALDVTFSIFVMTGVILLAVGLLADLIDKRLR